MRELPPIPAALGDAFSVADAIAAGVPRQRLLAGDLERPFRGARVREGAILIGAPEPVAGRAPSDAQLEVVDALRRMHSLAPVMPERAFFLGPSAALGWNTPLPAALHGVLYVGTLHPGTPMRRDGLRSVQIMPHLVDVTEHDGFRLTTPASTWATLAPFLSVRDLVVVGDHMVRLERIPGTSRLRRPPLASIDELAAAAAAGRRVGVGKLLDALPHVRTGSASRPETVTRLILLDAGLPEPELNADIFDEDGELVACGDLVYRRARVVVEFEGDGHRERAQFLRDIDRYQRLTEIGWDRVRLTGHHVFRQPAEVVRRVSDALLRAGMHF
ncbi:endonuclease domain-containing protein [Microbacterium gilvum]|uniref:DUF559 domain-containing protein n=1 Tax=Microbacterium gilvum TaxID=1336204 RepID=A0ABP9AAX8_9MICO